MKKVFALFVLLVTSILHSQETDTLKVDAVELVKGKEILGKENYAVTRDNYTYLFSNNKNKSIFKQHPADYEIQLGGACGRMGPLSGKGKTDLYFVYKDKIYIFASPACKATFEKFPDKLLEFDDAKPSLTAEALEEGAILLNKVIDAIGGAEKIDAVISYQEVSQKEIEHQGKNVAVAKTRAFVFPDKLREDEVFSNWTWGNVVNKEDAYHYYNETKRSMVQDQASAMQRLFNRNLIYILKSRKREDFFALAEGKGKIGNKEIELLTVYFNGSKSRLGIDAETGKVLNTTYFGRGRSAFMGEVVIYFTDFKLIDGLLLPMTVSGTFDGEIMPSWSETFASIKLNEKFDE